MPITVKTHRKTSKNFEAEHASLSRRDLQLAHLVSEGRLNKEISFSLGITEGTVKVYMSHLFAKLGVGNRAELAAWAVRNETQLVCPEITAKKRESYHSTKDGHYQMVAWQN